ncbi:uncharacterized protein LOC120694418 [Panicum virgatum]|uniref:uncharacterized protein LOC120694174 n=1 Tax=Panicum virgatum TaxID=38727 RepID=UPI0019D571C4|nr:uncharacterized protein LOC120694174 [Panicum virgatum]XP_039833470.1 uncharacterized protein LOC120694418 [Panicum virgatum]
MDELGLHFMDIFHKSYCGISPPHWEESDKYGPRTPCAVELSEAGIHFKKSHNDSIHGVDFDNAILSMPLFKLQGSTETILLNLMVFEWLHPDAKRDVRSYISFLDDIIESEEDVALLRSKGIFENLSGSDKKVVEIFSTLTKLSRVPIRGSSLGYVQWKVNAHCKKRWNKWWASFVKTYLSNPWVFISLVAAIILLIATLLQTVYTIMPIYNKG